MDENVDIRVTEESSCDNVLKGTPHWVFFLLLGILVLIVFLFFTKKGRVAVVQERLDQSLREVEHLSQSMANLKVRLDSMEGALLRQVTRTRAIYSHFQREILNLANALSNKQKKLSQAQSVVVSKKKKSQHSSDGDKKRVHDVQIGDTFDKIAQKYNLTVQSVRQANASIDPRKIQIGQQIILP